MSPAQMELFAFARDSKETEENPAISISEQIYLLGGAKKKERRWGCENQQQGRRKRETNVLLLPLLFFLLLRLDCLANISSRLYPGARKPRPARPHLRAPFLSTQRVGLEGRTSQMVQNRGGERDRIWGCKCGQISDGYRLPPSL